MSRAVIGLFAGMALAFAGWFGGFGAFLIVAALGAAGCAAGAWLDRGGSTDDVREVFRDRGRERRGERGRR